MRKIYESRKDAERAAYLRNREKIVEKRRKFRAENRDAINEQRRMVYRLDPAKQERVWAANLFRRTGCTVERYRAMWDEQRGCCAVCNRHLLRQATSAQRACVDHCHKTGAIRGLLCHRCNVFLGMLDDDALREAAIRYKRLNGNRDQEIGGHRARRKKL